MDETPQTLKKELRQEARDADNTFDRNRLGGLLMDLRTVHPERYRPRREEQGQDTMPKALHFCDTPQPKRSPAALQTPETEISFGGGQMPEGVLPMLTPVPNLAQTPLPKGTPAARLDSNQLYFTTSKLTPQGRPSTFTPAGLTCPNASGQSYLSSIPNTTQNPTPLSQVQANRNPLFGTHHASPTPQSFIATTAQGELDNPLFGKRMGTPGDGCPATQAIVANQQGPELNSGQVASRILQKITDMSIKGEENHKSHEVRKSLFQDNPASRSPHPH